MANVTMATCSIFARKKNWCTFQYLVWVKKKKTVDTRTRVQFCSAKAAFHDTDRDSDTDVLARILARMSVSWNAGLTAPASECTNYILWLRRSVCGRPSCNNCHSFQPLFESIRHCGLRYDGHPLRCCGHPPRAFVARIASTARCARCGLAYCCRCHCHM